MTDLSDTTNVVENLLQTKNRRDRHLFGPGPKRILSFDGGGVRGAISVAFLERIETIFAEHQRKLLTDYIAAKERAGHRRRKPRRRARSSRRRSMLADWFDLVGGTSTGSLIAGAIALGFNTTDIKKFYIERAPFVFQRPFWRIPGLQAKFDARALRQEIDAIVAQRTLDSEDLITGLSVVSKRMDTGSPWIVTNNPRSPLLGHQAADAGRSRLSRQPALQARDAGARQHRRAALLRSRDRADPRREEENKGRIAGPEDRDWLDQLNDKLGRFPASDHAAHQAARVPDRGRRRGRTRRRTGCSSTAA